jgi:hypothetical protein
MMGCPEDGKKRGDLFYWRLSACVDPTEGRDEEDFRKR